MVRVVMGDWSGLLPELVADIAGRLQYVEDFIALRGVCRWWRTAVCNKDFGGGSVSLLMHAERCGGNGLNFYSLYKKKCVRRICEPLDWDWDGSYRTRFRVGYGWLLIQIKSKTNNLDERLCLMNPILGTHMEVPPPKFSVRDINAAKVSADPSSHDDFVLLLHPKDCLGLWRPGQETWTRIETPSSMRNVTCRKHCFYAIDKNGCVWTLDPSDMRMRRLLTITDVDWSGYFPHLVDSSDGELLVIYEDTDLPPQPNDTAHARFVVVKVDVTTGEWKEMSGLGEYAVLFDTRDTGCTAPQRVKAAAGIKPNCIYFFHRFFRGANPNYRLLVYDIKDRRICTFGGLKFCNSTTQLYWFDSSLLLKHRIPRYIPEDLMAEILMRVPTRSVCVFRGLSKHYRALIDSAGFIRKNYEVSIKGIILIRTDPAYPVLVHLDFESGFKVAEFIPPCAGKFQFLGCHMGILCLQISTDARLMFWNPITGAARCHLDTMVSPSLVTYFSGYDSVADDIKVLKTTLLARPEFQSYDCVVYSSKTDSWKRTQGFDDIKDADGRRLVLEGRTGVFVGNCVHIFAHFIGKASTKVLLAYDFMSEKFNLVPLPKSKTSCPHYKLSSVDGCLCLLMSSEPSHKQQKMEGWIMKEYGNRESWALVFSITPHPWSAPVGLVGINGSPHLLIQSSSVDGMELYMYDVNRKHFCYNIHAPTKHTTTLLDVSYYPLQHLPFLPTHRQP